MAYYLRKVSDLTVDDIKKLNAAQLELLFADDLNPDDPPAKIALWLDSIKELEYFPTSFRYVLWEDDEWYAQASVFIGPFDDDPEVCLLQCRYDMEALCSGLVTAICQYAIQCAFTEGVTNQILAHATLDDLGLQKLYSTIPISENPSREELCDDRLNQHGLSHMIEKENSARSTWNVGEILIDAKDRMNESAHSLMMIDALMDVQNKENNPFFF